MLKYAFPLLTALFLLMAFVPHDASALDWPRGGSSNQKQKKVISKKRNGEISPKMAHYEVDVEFGSVDVSDKELDTGWMLEWSGFTAVAISPTHPAGDFYLHYNTCQGTLGGNGGCEVGFRFEPSSEGPKAATAVFNVTYHSSSGPSTTDTWTFYLTGQGLLPVDEMDAGECGSYISVTEQVLGERIPIVGTDYFLNYSSRYANEYTPQPQTYIFDSDFSFAEDGWAFSPHKLYDYQKKRLFSADGNVISAKFEEVDPGIIGVLNPNGEEIYIFALSGRHLQTLSVLTGVVKQEFEYDSNQRLIKIRDRHGLETLITRNSNGNITSITSPYGQVTQIGVSVAGKISSIQNPNSETYLFTYKSGTGLLETMTKPGGQVSTFTYNSQGRLTKDLGHGGNFWEIIKDVSGTITKSSQMGRETSYTKSRPAGGDRVRSEIHPDGSAVTYTEKIDRSTIRQSPVLEESVVTVEDERFPQALMRPFQVKTKENGQESTTEIGQVFNFGSGTGYFDYVSRTKTFTTSGRVRTEVFDRATRKTTVTSAEGATTELVLNELEQPSSLKIGSDIATTLTYDLNGRLSGIAQGTKNTETYTYASNGFLQSSTNGRSETTSYAYDLVGRLTQMTLPDLRTIGFSYDANGNRTGIVTPANVTHEFEFNAMELESKYEPPAVTDLSPKDTTYAYNLDRQLTQILRPDGKWANYTYDAGSGRLTSISTDGGDYGLTYSTSAPELVSEISSPQGLKNVFTYRGYKIASDEQIQVSDDTSFGKVSFGYDADHRRISRTIRDSANSNFITNFTLNDDDLPASVGDMSLAYSYPSGRLASTILHKISDLRTYDSVGMLATYTATFTPDVGSPVVLYSYSLARDVMSRIVGKTESVLGTTSVYEYEYDSAGRLISVLKDSQEVANFTYDLNGNRTSFIRNGHSLSATYDAQDRLMTYGSRSYSHTKNGDLEEISGVAGEVGSFGYDVFGNLRQAEVPGKAVSYRHDGQNRRVERIENGIVTARYLYEDQLRIAAELNSAGVLRKGFVYATGAHVPDFMVEGGNSYRILTDHLGSPRLVVDTETGAISQRMDYDILGRITLDSNSCFQPFGFAGGLHDDATKLVRFGARDYDPETGRWTSKDPILFDGGDTNLYGYVLNDPVNLIDLSGNQAIPIPIPLPVPLPIPIPIPVPEPITFPTPREKAPENTAPVCMSRRSRICQSAYDAARAGCLRGPAIGWQSCLKRAHDEYRRCMDAP